MIKKDISLYKRLELTWNIKSNEERIERKEEEVKKLRNKVSVAVCTITEDCTL